MDNLDLMIRRKRLGLRQRDIMERLGLSRTADLSEFEHGHRRDLPHGLGRIDYERTLTDFEAERAGAA